MKKIIFFDVDGTLANSRGKVLPSTIEAIQKWREQGNLAYVCTGRSKPEITTEILSPGFDGVIGAGGGYIEMNGKVFLHQRMSKELVLRIKEYFEERDIGYYLESNDGLFGSANVEEKIIEEGMKYFVSMGKTADDIYDFQWFFDLLNEHSGMEVNYANVNKIAFINNTVPYSEVYELFGEEASMYHSTVKEFGKESGEIGIKGLSKQTAIQMVMEELGIAQEDSIGFGDWDNDIPMFETVGYKVAMANASDKLKSIADEVTDDLDNDGIYNAMFRNGWIS